MHYLYVTILLWALSLTISYGQLSYSGESNTRLDDVNHQNTLLSEFDSQLIDDTKDGSSSSGSSSLMNGNNYDKRVERYAFGLGRRAYTYSNGNGIKRLPLYNFGLGKRARPNSFGLGKRSEYNNNDDLYSDNDLIIFPEEKRNRPYSFGLGKRDMLDDVERRAYPNRYGFGLGR